MKRSESVMADVDPDSTTVLLVDGADDDDDSSVVTAVVIAIIVLCCIVTFLLFMCFRLNLIPDAWRRRLCPCLKEARQEDVEMGYLPANITVNRGAVQKGVPDIFLRQSQSERISVGPASFESSRDSAAAEETSGSWAEYLRRATLRASSAGRRGVGVLVESDVNAAVVAESAKTTKAEQ